MRLAHVNDKILILDLKKLVNAERQATASLLFHLREVEKRRLFSTFNCTSMFVYCVRELGYSESAAHRRLAAARLLKDIPEIASKIESGDLTLTNISLVNNFFESLKDKKEALEKIEGLSKKDAEKKLFQMTGRVIDPPPSKKKISDDETQIAIVLKDETLKLMEKAQSLSGKTDMDELIEFAMKLVIERLEAKSLSPAAVAVPVKQVCMKCGKSKSLHGHRMSLGIEKIRMLCFYCHERLRRESQLPATPG